MFKVPEQYRLTTGISASTPAYLNNGVFIIPSLIPHRQLEVIASDGLGWEHVSVVCYRKNKACTPNWDEMSHIKNMFWDQDDIVVQFYPDKDNYVNIHPHALHLWRKRNSEFELPPRMLV